MLIRQLNNHILIFLNKGQMFHDQMKHIDVGYHFVREIIDKCELVVNKININENIVDMFIKSLPINQF